MWSIEESKKKLLEDGIELTDEEIRQLQSAWYNILNEIIDGELKLKNGNQQEKN